MTVYAAGWEQVDTNKWGLQVTDTNYMFIHITHKDIGKYGLTYMDAELQDYDESEKSIVQRKYNPQTPRDLALKVVEHYGHKEWEDEVSNKEALIQLLEDATSFDPKNLKDLA